MGKIVTTKITRFDGGMSNDVRSTDFTKGRLVKNFDCLTYPHRLVPLRSSEDGNDGVIATSITDFVQAEGKTWAIGRNASTAKTQIVYRSAYSTGSWSQTSNSVSGSLAPVQGVYPTYYKGAIYGSHGSNSWFKYVTDGGSAFTDNINALSYTTFAPGLVHSKDDIYYQPYDNKMARNNAGSISSLVLTIPADLLITSIAEYNNYVAIGAQPLSTAGHLNSVVYFWNRDDSLTTFSETVDWGPETLKVLESVDVELLGVSVVSDSTTNFSPKLVFKRYAGLAGAQKIMELAGDANTTITLDNHKQKLNGRVYFKATITLDGTVQSGIWSFGKNQQGRYTVTLERLVNNDTAPNSMYGFLIVGDYTFAAYNNGSSDVVSKTDDSSSAFSATSVYETLKFNQGDPTTTKKLKGITVAHNPIPATGSPSVTLKYKKDGETSFTTIATWNTAALTAHDAVSIESTGATLPQYSEIQFRIESLGVEITALTFQEEEIKNAPYA